MSERAFYKPEARARVTAAVKAIEAQTSAEVAVALRHLSGGYRDIDMLFGLALVLAMAVGRAVVDRSFAPHTLPLDIVAAFALGALVCAQLWTLRRRLVPRSRQRTQVREAALATFTRKGIARTHARCGILVYVSLFERRVEVIPDLGVDVAALPGWRQQLEAMQAALRHRHDLDAFIEALRGLGPVLGELLPHTANCANALPDEPDAS